MRHTHSLDGWQHSHVLLGQRCAESERRTWLVVALTATMMVAEIIGGMIFGSMALVADGCSALAYRFARRHAHDERLSHVAVEVHAARDRQGPQAA